MKQLIFIFIMLYTYTGSAYAEEYDYEMDDIVLSKEIPDPLEKVNRITFIVNDMLGGLILYPSYKLYNTVTNEFIRARVDNFLSNLTEPVSFINNIFQGKIDQAIQNFSRFLINSTVGVFGIMDIASHEKIYPAHNNFFRTISYLSKADCINSDAYLVLPVLGPSSIHSGIGLAIDIAIDPFTHILSKGTLSTKTGLLVVHTYNKNANFIQEMKNMSFDEYIMVRSIYSQRYQYQCINNKR